MALKRTLLSAGSLGTALATIATGGWIGVCLVCGLLTLGFSLIALLAVTGTFAHGECCQNAQAVLAILLGRDQPRRAASTRPKRALDSSKRGLPRSLPPSSAA
jgi:hypothetical protein